jgi:hypothetical protein
MAVAKPSVLPPEAHDDKFVYRSDAQASRDPRRDVGEVA